MSDSERIPLHKFCPLEGSQLDYLTKQELRDRAGELFYSELKESNEVAPALEAEFGVTQEIAVAAVECLHKIMRRNCSTCAIGATATGLIRRAP